MYISHSWENKEDFNFSASQNWKKKLIYLVGTVINEMPNFLNTFLLYLLT